MSSPFDASVGSPESGTLVKGPQGLVGNGVQVVEASLGEGLGIQDYVGELEFFDMDAETREMELPSVCTTDLEEWWEPWTEH